MSTTSPKISNYQVFKLTLMIIYLKKPMIFYSITIVVMKTSKTGSVFWFLVKMPLILNNNFNLLNLPGKDPQQALVSEVVLVINPLSNKGELRTLKNPLKLEVA